MKIIYKKKINECISNWNPIGVPIEISDVEYIPYISNIAKNVNNKRKLHSSIISMLKSLGINKVDDVLQKDIIIIERSIIRIQESLNNSMNQASPLDIKR